MHLHAANNNDTMIDNNTLIEFPYLLMTTMLQHCYQFHLHAVHIMTLMQFLLVLQFLSLDLYILQHNLLCIFSTRLPALPCYTIRHLYPKPIDTALCLNWHGYCTFNTLIAKPVLKRILFCIKFAYRAQELKDYVRWRYFFHLTRDHLLVEMKNKNISRLTGLILLSSSDAG